MKFFYFWCYYPDLQQQVIRWYDDWLGGEVYEDTTDWYRVVTGTRSYYDLSMWVISTSSICLSKDLHLLSKNPLCVYPRIHDVPWCNLRAELWAVKMFSRFRHHSVALFGNKSDNKRDRPAIINMWSLNTRTKLKFAEMKCLLGVV